MMLTVSLEFAACVLLMAATALAVAEGIVTALAARRPPTAQRQQR